jgi:RNA-binding protein
MRRKVRIGVPSHISKSSGNLILKAERKARIGAPVLNREGRRIGFVYDLFGPISNPYIAVRPTVENPERYVEEPLYIPGR